LSEKIKTLKAFTELAYMRFENSVKDLKEAESLWRPVPEANNIKWILTHLSQQWNISLQRILKGDISYKPSGWPDNYAGDMNMPLPKLLEDLKKGKEMVLAGVDKLTPEALAGEIVSPRGTRKREDMFMTQLSEIIHHEGQIAFIRGAIGRRRQADPNLLA
jgi:hypothetical protein